MSGRLDRSLTSFRLTCDGEVGKGIRDFLGARMTLEGTILEGLGERLKASLTRGERKAFRRCKGLEDIP